MDLLDIICEGYIENCLKDGINENVKEVEAFLEKYVRSLLEENPKEGLKMEAMFSSAVSETETQAFKTGFKACMDFMVDYLKGNL